jgi:uncharacterized protein
MNGLAAHFSFFLFVAGVLGGALNSVAGGGTFVLFPALLVTGVPAIPANATNTVALWLGTAASTRAYWHRLDASRRILVPMALAGIAGGAAGALLLIHTPASTFMHVVPWLMLAATLLFTFGGHLSGVFHSGVAQHAAPSAIAWATLVEALVALYGGYFGGGIGIMNLALLAALGMTDIHAMNALKVILVSVINGTAIVMFVATRTIYWPQAIVATSGALLGGYYGAHYAQRLPQTWVRALVILTGALMTTYFFAKAY